MSTVSNNILSRVYILMGVFLFFSALIVLRVLALQINHKKWMRLEMEEKISFKRVLADRGNILSEDGTIMATSIPFYRIAMDPTIIDTTQIPYFKDSVFILASHLATEFGETVTDTIMENDTVMTFYSYKDTMAFYRRIIKAMHEKDRHIYLTNKIIDFQKLREVEKWPIVNRGRYQGGFLVEKIHNRRYYPFENLARITLGRLVNDTNGIRGIEAAYNRELRGRDSYMLVQKVAGDSYIPLEKYGAEGAVDGLDVVTTLDVNLQDVVEKALQRGVERNFAEFGTAILIEVETGKIKALANYPEEYNYGVATRIEPGSTFKLASAVALLEDEMIGLDDTVETGDGTILYDDKLVTDDHVLGTVPFKDVFTYSSNVGMSKTVQKSYGENPNRFLEHLNNFGFNQPANNQIKGERPPLVYKPGDDMWNAATTLPSMAFGYSLEVTPLQMAAFYNAIANNGKRLRPWIVKEIRNNSQIVQQFHTEVIHENICSPATIEQVHYLMRRVVEIGTAKRAFEGISFKVAGKTGTARKFENGRYLRRYRASFGGFFPADNPKYTCYIMVDEPRTRAISGGRVAAPIFRDIAEEVYTIDMRLAHAKSQSDSMRHRPVLPQLMYTKNTEALYKEFDLVASTEDQPKWASIQQKGDTIILEQFQPSDTIPDVRGMSSKDAIHILENMGISVKLKGFGRVKRQSLLPGYKIKDNTKITLVLG